MSEYTDTKLINCNRLASVESRTGNDSNPAIFTNPLNETVRLDVGDKVSLERAFVNELGAGNPQTIEFKGESKGSNRVATYSKIDYNDYYRKMAKTYDPKYRLGYYRSITTTEESNETVDLRDNLAPLVYGYYITINEYPNYIQQPRRFISEYDTRGQIDRTYPDQYSKFDGLDQGRTKFVTNLRCFCFADWIFKTGESKTKILKQKVDNKRFTLFIKDKIAYSIGAKGKDGLGNNDTEQFPKNYHNGIFQEAKYIRYREKLDINVNKGFNTPSAVASQITQQLTETKNEDIFQIYDQDVNIRSVTKTIETNTFKPINCQNIYNVCEETLTKYLEQPLPVTDANINQLAVDYISTFGYIAVKRPEIFESGRGMAKKLNDQQPTIRDSGGTILLDRKDDFEGFQTVGTQGIPAVQSVNEDTSITFNVLYTEANLKIIRDFFDTQALYPELWDKLQESILYEDFKLGTNTLPTIQNSRFFHMNVFTTDQTATFNTQTFGDDMFSLRGGFFDSEDQMTLPVFFKYDDTLRDKFIPANEYSSGLSMGFAIPVRTANYDDSGNRLDDIFLIKVTNDGVGGVSRNFFNETSGANVEIKEGRRIGYDFHSSAYSTCILTPYSGYTNTDIGVVASNQTGSGGIDSTFPFPGTINFIRSYINLDKVTDLNPYMTMTYVGANNPELRYNGETNRFELSRFHTGNNVGNDRNAGNGATSINSDTRTPALSLDERTIAPPSVNQDAGQTVYKINPRPCQFGFSPTFKPYQRNDQAYRTNVYPETPKQINTTYSNLGGNTQKYNAWNDNIEAYTVFDSHGGIYIDDWGFDRDNWNDSLWDILGFDYDAVNAPPSNLNVLTRRVDNENSDLLYRPTTNAEVVTTDTKSYITNEYGAVMYYTSLPYPNCVVDYRARLLGGNYLWTFSGDGGDTARTASNAAPLELWGEVNILTTSTNITASSIQKSVLRPYYTIRSNILEGFSAIGGNPTGSNLPIIGIVDKYSGASDYFLGNPSDIQFTITKPTMIADITTSIHDSDGKYANVDKTSAVIYKIQKVRRTPTGIIDDIMALEKQEEKKNKK